MSKEVVLKCVEIDGIWKMIAFPNQMAVNKFLDCLEGAVIVDGRWINGDTVAVKSDRPLSIKITPRPIISEEEYEVLKKEEEARKAAEADENTVADDSLEDTDAQESASESEDCCGESDCICNAAPTVQTIESSIEPVNFQQGKEEREAGLTDEIPLPEEPEDIQAYPHLVSAAETEMDIPHGMDIGDK